MPLFHSALYASFQKLLHNSLAMLELQVWIEERNQLDNLKMNKSEWQLLYANTLETKDFLTVEK